jgi:hypothetical protein
VLFRSQFVKDLKWTYDVLTADPTNEDWGTGFQQLGTGGAAMYLGATDAVGMPTETNGLPVGDLALVPTPAGSAGQFILTGGTYYAFAPNATDEQINALFYYLELMGRSPDLNPNVIAGLEADAQSRRNRGVPIIDEFPAWSDPTLIAAKQAANAKFANTDPRLYADFFAAIQKPGVIRTEDGGPITQDFYAELTKCLQEVLTNRNADPKALLDTAQANVQRMLDAVR